MPRKRQVYLLDPKLLDPETIAVTFAKTSRSPLGFREIAAELTAEKSAQFHEKWVVGYGHASVAEHAVLHVGIENISRLAVEILQSNRLASYTEKSTRYQKWNSEDFYYPQELENPRTGEAFGQAVKQLFATYEMVFEKLMQDSKAATPRLAGEPDTAWENRVRCTCVDACRFLLPACALANVGMTINARSLEHSLCKMLSDPLPEVRAIGSDLKTIASAAVPTLVKYAQENPFLGQICQEMHTLDLEKSFSSKGGDDWCTLLDFDQEMEENILAAAFFRFNPIGFLRAREIVSAMSAGEKDAVARRLLGSLGEHDEPLREFEYGAFTFELVLDQGAFYELKRHRMMTLTPQPLSTRLGYATPKAIADAGSRLDYDRAMQLAAQAFERLSEHDPTLAAYIVPNGYNRRIVLSMNLRSAWHLLSLRTAPNAHFSLRRIAQRMGEILRSKLPILGKYLPVNETENWRTIQDRYFA